MLYCDIHACTHTYIYIYIYIYIYTYIYLCVCVCVCVRVEFVCLYNINTEKMFCQENIF